MSKRSDGPQLDLDLSGINRQQELRPKHSCNAVAPFVDAATLQIRRDATRRVAANGIFHIPGPSRRG